MLIGIDVGGTFTDAVLIAGGKVAVQVKVPTDGCDLLATVLKALDELLQGVAVSDVERVALSTTLVTNAIVQGQVEPVGLFIMPGPGADWKGRVPGDPLVLSGYVDHRGRVRQKAGLDELAEACRNMPEQKIFAVSGKFSVRNPELENEVAQSLGRQMKPLNITCGASVSGSLNFIRRTNSAYYNAAVWKRFQDFAGDVELALTRRRILAPIYILKADGGTIPLATAKNLPVESIFTGPAASVLGVMALCRPESSAVSLDIGGTTTDIAFWKSGAPLFDAKGASIDGYNTAVRTFRLRSIGLGGDSWVRRDSGALEIGPERKGPAMALGGPVPTVTDALVVAKLCQIGDPAKAEAAISLLSFPGKSIQETAAEIINQSAELIRTAVDKMLAEEAASPVYRVADIVQPDRFEPELLIGVGGGARGLAPVVAQLMNLRWQVPEYAMVANACGAALARPTLDITLRADTAAQEYAVPELGLRRKLTDRRCTLEQVRQLAGEHLQERATIAGIAVPDIETTFEEEFNLIRGYSTVGKIFSVGVQIKPGILVDLSAEDSMRGDLK